MLWHTIDYWLDAIGYTIVGFWILQFIWYAYIKGYDVKDPPRQNSNDWY